MLTAFVLVCQVAMLRECDVKSASLVLQVPEHYNSPYSCLSAAVTFAAGSLPTMKKDEAFKIICTHAGMNGNVG